MKNDSKNKLYKMTKKFLLGESYKPPSLMSYVHSLNEILNRFIPKTLREKRDLEIAKEHLREIKRSGRKMLEQITVLEEKLTVLEEERNKK